MQQLSQPQSQHHDWQQIATEAIDVINRQNQMILMLTEEIARLRELLSRKGG